MTRRLRKTAHAEADIRSIARWIARDSVAAALKWLGHIDRRFQGLAEIPGSGTDQSALRPGLRSSPFGNYLIFFKRMRDGIMIVRVVHGAPDYARFFKKD